MWPCDHPLSSRGAWIALSVKRFVFVWRLATYPFSRGSNRAGGMLAKISSGEKNISMKIPAECVSGFTEYFPGSRELPWLPSTSRQSCKMGLEAELLGWRRFRKLNYLVLDRAKFMVHGILQFYGTNNSMVGTIVRDLAICVTYWMFTSSP